MYQSYLLSHLICWMVLGPSMASFSEVEGGCADTMGHLYERRIGTLWLWLALGPIALVGDLNHSLDRELAHYTILLD